MPSAFIRTVLTATCLVAFPLLAAAKTYSIPDPNPVAVITLPDGWESSEIDKGVQSTSEDETVYVSVEVTELKDAAQAIADAVTWLKSKDVVIDQASQEQKPFSINGLEGVQVKWNGKDEDGPTHVSLTLLQVTDTKGLVLTYWASPEGETENLKDLSSIINSLKGLK
ncbi:histidine kinase [Bosea sp. 685]|uniref:histidine kinase n=1 Tax=Bosea sp. 685 TaxID=3080057 RepID=UPI002892D78D|nr:histidine kinase [Bosea sp. 685]WNJ90862.1 histidine kinase [Bosea sp. 685]